jgi:hypothetical protein
VGAVVGVAVGSFVFALIGAIWVCMCWGRVRRRKEAARAAARQQSLDPPTPQSLIQRPDPAHVFDEFGGKYSPRCRRAGIYLRWKL